MGDSQMVEAVQPGLGTIPGSVDEDASRWLGLGYTSLFIGLITLVSIELATPSPLWLHALWCGAMSVAISARLMSSARHGVGVLLTNHRIVFAAAFFMYFVLGASIFLFPSIAPAARLVVGYPITVADVLFVDAANSIGFGIALLVSVLLPSRGAYRMSEGIASELRRLPAPAVIGAFIVVGAAASVVVGLTDLGIGPRLVAGAWRTMADLALVGVFLSLSYRGKGGRMLAIGALALVVVQSGVGLLLFNKTRILLPVGAALLGLASKRGSWKPIVVGMLVIAVSFSMLGSLVTFARNTFPRDGSGDILAARVEVLQRGVSGGIDSGPAASYSGWSRICYVPEQNAARVLYESGNGGDDIRVLPWVLVPRALVPSKPIITSAGPAFYKVVSGNPFGRSASSPGVLMGGYYSGGWVGLILVSMAAGAILAFTSAVARAAVRQRSVAMLPIAFLGVMIAFRIDGHFVADYVGRAVYVVYAVAILGLVRMAVAPRDRDRQSLPDGLRPESVEVRGNR